MVPRISKTEYIIFILIVLLFVVSVGKYTKDLSKNVSIIENELASLQLAQVNALSLGSTETFALTQKDGVWNIEGTDFVTLENADGNLSLQVGTSTGVERFSLTIDEIGTYTTRDGVVRTELPFVLDKDSTLVLSVQEDLVPLFGYHNVLADDEEITDPSVQIHESLFREQIRFATEDLNCQWYTFRDIMENYVIPQKKSPRNACVLTFDDGFESMHTRVLPILDEFGIKASFFVIVGKLDNPQRYLSWQQLDDIYAAGHEIASHGFNTGGFLSEKRTLEDIEFQLTESRRELMERGYSGVKTFAYPLGEWNAEIIDLTREAGYIAVRDTQKDNSWRDKRPVTLSFDEDVRWHMNYFRPEVFTNDEIRDVLGYNGYWQFEEGYRVVYEGDDPISILSSTKPHNHSYGVVRLQNPGDSIGVKFQTTHAGEHKINILIGTRDGFQEDSVGAYVDGTRFQLTRIPNTTCEVERIWNFCTYTLTANIDVGIHELAISTFSNTVLLDYFSVLRNHELSERYQVTLSYEN